MKSKVSLMLTELCIMLLTLALAAALCLRIFLWADQTSRESAARDAALIHMQGVAEMLKATGSPEATVTAMAGANKGDFWYIPTETYEIRIIPADPQAENLRSVYLEALYQDDLLIRFPVYWQEVAP